MKCPACDASYRTTVPKVCRYCGTDVGEFRKQQNAEDAATRADFAPLSKPIGALVALIAFCYMVYGAFSAGGFVSAITEGVIAGVIVGGVIYFIVYYFFSQIFGLTIVGIIILLLMYLF